MAEPGNGKQQGKLYTLSEVSKKTGISMPTLQRYKKLYQGRIPSEGSGRKQRYPESALAVFGELKRENVGRRGRPRKDASAPSPARKPGRKPGARQAASKRQPAAKKGAAKAAAAPAKAAKTARSGNLLTLTEVSRLTGISYPTAVRYVRLYSDRLPHEGKGRARRFHPEAVDVFRQLRQEGGRGGRKSGAAPAGAKRRGRPAKDEGFLANRVRDIERAQESLEKRIKGLIASLQKLVR